MNWHIGQEVVCVNDSGFTSTYGKPLVEGEIYTIQGIAKYMCKCRTIVLDVGIPLAHKACRCSSCGETKLPNPLSGWAFDHRRFAPLMDISELEALLHPEVKNEEV